MRFSFRKISFRLILVGALLQTTGGIAVADETDLIDGTDTQKRKTVTREILASMDDPKLSEKSFRDRFKLHKKSGVIYRQSLSMGKSQLSLQLSGPLVKRKPGLKIQLRGMQIGGHEVIVKGYGTPKKQRIGFEMRF